MYVRDLASTALKGVTVNASRSLLTMLGIIIGVGSVVLMSSIGGSMEGVILGQISSLGPKSMVIFPGQQEGGASQMQAGFDSLTLRDVEELKKLSSITRVAPVIFVQGTVSYGREEASPQVFGTTANFFLNQSIEVAEGRILTQEDDESASFVALLAPDTAEKLFGNRDPLGKRITIGDRNYTVVGVTKALGSQFFQNADDRIYVPFSVARQVSGQKYVNYLTMEAVDSFDLAFSDVRYLLRRQHGIDNPEDDETKDDFVVRSAEQANQILGTVSLGLTMFITTIAGISLLVGGIGIMNIMLVSVTERTREIGLRKAIGATRGNILLQFLSEAVMLTCIGGLTGIAGGVGISFLAALLVGAVLPDYVFVLSSTSILVSFGMAVLTGLVFGISPARRAASLPPMEALRYE